MARLERRTQPDHETSAWPPGVPYIVGNEGCERFSYYGMRSILTVHLVTLFVSTGLIESEADASATAMAHIFFAAVYAFPVIGALIADRLLGKYNTIFWLSLVYCGGHAVLAVGENSIGGMALGLGLIAVGSGGIKPCVSANVGDQFGKKNWFRVKSIFQVFYFSINFGSFFATLLIPWLRKRFSNAVAFGLPGVLMAIATVFFWGGRNKYVHVPPTHKGKLGLLDSLSGIAFFLTVGHLFVTGPVLHLPLLIQAGCSAVFLVIGLALFNMRQRIKSDDGFLSVVIYSVQNLSPGSFWKPATDKFGEEATDATLAVFKVVSVFFLVSMFWALFEQHGSTWIIQAKSMDLNFMGRELLPSQIAALNPLMVMVLIPTMNQAYKLSEKLGYELTPLRRMTGGMFMAAASFAVIALIQGQIDASGKGIVSVGWQILPYILVTIAEVMVSITGLEFAYTQAPRRMKSTIMSLWLLTVSLGQVFVILLAGLKDLPIATFFWVFTGLMFGASVLFGIRARFYQIRDYPQ